MANTLTCIKLKKELEGLAAPPFPGKLGLKIFENVSKEAWSTWLEQQIMLVNENRLNLADPEASSYLMQQTERYFFSAGDDVDTASGYTPPKDNN